MLSILEISVYMHTKEKCYSPEIYENYYICHQLHHSQFRLN